MFSPFDRFGGMGNLYNPATAIPNWVLTPSGNIPDYDIDFANNRAFVKSLSNVVLPSSIITCTRSTAATSLDASGNLVSFLANAPRITSKGLLIEELRTNLLLWSQAPGANPGSWANSGATPPTLTDNSITSPDGTVDASLWTRNVNTASFTAQVITKAASALTYTLSFFVKKNQSQYCAVRMQGTFPSRADVTFDLTNGVISAAATATSTFTNASATITPVAQGFYYITFTCTTDTTTSLTNAFSFNGNGGPIDVSSATPQSGYVFGFQLELASFATSYILTTSASATRDHDVIACAVTGVGSSATVLGIGLNQVPLGTGQQVVNLNDGTASNSVGGVISSAGFSQAAISASGVSQYNQLGGSWTQNTIGKIAVAATAGTQNAAFNGTLMTTGTGANFPSGLNTVRIGANALGTAAFFNSNVTRETYWLTKLLSTANLQTITT